MFDLHRFVEKCRAAVREDPTHRRKHVARAVSDPVSDPSELIAALGEPKLAIVDFWHRLAEVEGGKIEATGAKSPGVRDAEPASIIPSVRNPLDRNAIDVYGGDFFAIPRSEWDPDTLVEASVDVHRTIRKFEEANAAYGARRRAS